MPIVGDLRPYGRLLRVFDFLLKPFMYALAGTVYESPQRSHRWNVERLGNSARLHLKYLDTVREKGIPRAIIRKSTWDFRFHAPVWGGWRHYVVLVPPDHQGAWHIGWFAGDESAVSRIPLVGAVRMLVGPHDTVFFAVGEEGVQLPLHKIGEGIVGKGGVHCKLPLL